MVEVEKLSWSYPQKDLYTDISFKIPDGNHCVLIGSNGTGKTTLLELIAHTGDYVIHHGKIRKKDDCRIGFVQQLVHREKEDESSVFAWLCADFEADQEKMAEVCARMETTEDSEALFEEYQHLCDEFEAIDGYHCEQNIHKMLADAGLSYLEQTPVSVMSGGEYKLIQIIRQMLRLPDLLIMDEPDAFLDFDHIAGLGKLINNYKGTLLVVTHNRFLLLRCFNQVLQIENEGIRSFDGNYDEYQLWLLQMKAETQLTSDKESDWLRIQEQLVEKLRDDATKVIDPNRGRLLHARVSYLERLKKSHIERPYLEARKPEIHFPDVETSPEDPVITVENYRVRFDTELLNHVSFTLNSGEKLALIGPNGSGKTTLLKAIAKGNDSAIQIADGIKLGFLFQIDGETLNEEKTVPEQLRDAGVADREEARSLLMRVCLEDNCMNQKVRDLSGGEKNLLQLLLLSLGDSNVLLLDEPTSHLDLPTQFALEKAVKEYRGSILMVSHDYYSIAECAEAVLLVENGTIRRMSGRAFRKMFYKKYYRPEVLELEQKKLDLEEKIQSELRKNNAASAKLLFPELEVVIEKIKD